MLSLPPAPTKEAEKEMEKNMSNVGELLMD
jgi:hypothetical protein